MENFDNKTSSQLAKERVKVELDELNQKIVKLSNFLFSSKVIDANISHQMQYCLRDQLNYMQQYAQCLQKRLQIWDKSDEELDKLHEYY